MVAIFYKEKTLQTRKITALILLPKFLKYHDHKENRKIFRNLYIIQWSLIIYYSWDEIGEVEHSTQETEKENYRKRKLKSKMCVHVCVHLVLYNFYLNAEYTPYKPHMLLFGYLE